MASDLMQADKAVPDLKVSENAGEDNTPAGGSSDGEGGERTARERLKKTSIAGLSQYSKSGATGAVGDHPLAESITQEAPADPSNENGLDRGRPSKKRSFEDLQKDEHVGPTENGSLAEPDPRRSHHKRMRSRDVSGGNGQVIGKFDEPASPVREESDDGGPGGAGVLVDSHTKADTNAQRSLEDKILEEEDTTNEPTVGVAPETGPPSVSVREPQRVERKAGSSGQESTISPTSGLANVSSASPFGTVKSPPSTSKELTTASAEPAGTSTTAFKSSGLSAFASSEKSPFGASSTTQSSGGFGGGGSGFGGGSASGFGIGKPSGFGSGSTGFGAASSFAPKSTSGFGSTGGFGSKGAFGGGAAPRPFGGPISSFAGPVGGAGAFGKAKPFGTKDKDEDDDERSDDEDENGQQEDTDEKPDSRFQKQTLETGEEEEDTVFNARAKLFHFEDRQWKERGVGTLKINVRYEPMNIPSNANEDGEAEADDLEGGITPMARKGRVLMRTDGVHRVILNSPVFKEMNVGTKDGEEPSGRTMMLTGMEDNKPRGFQIRIGKEEVLKDFYYKIQELKAEL